MEITALDRQGLRVLCDLLDFHTQCLLKPYPSYQADKDEVELARCMNELSRELTNAIDSAEKEKGNESM